MDNRTDLLPLSCMCGWYEVRDNKEVRQLVVVVVVVVVVVAQHPLPGRDFIIATRRSRLRLLSLGASAPDPHTVFSPIVRVGAEAHACYEDHGPSAPLLPVPDTLVIVDPWIGPIIGHDSLEADCH